jgi:hypothetical protein
VSSVPQQGAARRAVASFRSYAEAQAAVDFLADRRFPVERLAIIGDELRIVEQVTGRLDYGRAALQGAVSGASTGALVGALFSLFQLFTPTGSVIAVILWGLVIGAVVGALFGVLAYAASGGRRDFQSVSGMEAGRYDVVVDEDLADDAARMLAQRAT